MKKKIKKTHVHAVPTNKEFDVLGKLWGKYGIEEIMAFLLYLERDMAMEHGAMCHGKDK